MRRASVDIESHKEYVSSAVPAADLATSRSARKNKEIMSKTMTKFGNHSQASNMSHRDKVSPRPNGLMNQTSSNF